MNSQRKDFETRQNNFPPMTPGVMALLKRRADEMAHSPEPCIVCNKILIIPRDEMAFGIFTAHNSHEFYKNAVKRPRPNQQRVVLYKICVSPVTDKPLIHPHFSTETQIRFIEARIEAQQSGRGFIPLKMNEEGHLNVMD